MGKEGVEELRVESFIEHFKAVNPFSSPSLSEIRGIGVYQTFRVVARSYQLYCVRFRMVLKMTEKGCWLFQFQNLRIFNSTCML